MPLGHQGKNGQALLQGRSPLRKRNCQEGRCFSRNCKDLSSKYLSFIKRKFLEAYTRSEPKIKQIVQGEMFTAVGCAQEQAYNSSSSIFVPVSAIDLFGKLKQDPDTGLGKLFYEKPDPVYNEFPFSMNKELYQRMQSPGQTFETEFGGNYLGGSEQELFNISYVTQNNKGISGNFFKVDLKNRQSTNNVGEFLSDYFTTIKMVDTTDLMSEIVNLVTNAVDIKAGLGLGELQQKKGFEAIIQRVLGLCFDSRQSIDVSGVGTGSTVTIKGNLLVQGVQTQVDSTTINLADNVLQLNAGGTNDGGLIVRDATGVSTTSGSLLWDVTNDYWKAGKVGSEAKVALMGGDNVVTSSAQILLTGVQGYSTLATWSGSVDVQLSNINLNTASVNISVTNLNQTSASVNTSVTNLNLTSASVNTSVSSLNTVSASVLTQLSTLGTYTASVETRLSTLATTTGSLITSQSNATISVANLNAASSSYETKGRGIVSGSSQIDITSTTGYSTFSGSIATSISASVAGATWDNLVGKPAGIVSGSVQVDITATTGFSTFSSSIETRISLIDGGTY